MLTLPASGTWAPQGNLFSEEEVLANAQRNTHTAEERAIESDAKRLFVMPEQVGV